MSESPTSRVRLNVSVKGVFIGPSEKISHPGRRLLTTILPVSFSKNDGHSSTRMPAESALQDVVDRKDTPHVGEGDQQDIGAELLDHREQFLDRAAEIIAGGQVVLRRWIIIQETDNLEGNEVMTAFMGDDDVGELGAEHQHAFPEQLMGDEVTGQEPEHHEPQT